MSQKERKSSTEPLQEVPIYDRDCLHGFANNFYYISKILKERTLSNGRTQLYVSWEGWPPKYNSWVYKETIMPLGELLKSVEASESSHSAVDIIMPKQKEAKPNKSKKKDKKQKATTSNPQAPKKPLKQQRKSKYQVQFTQSSGQTTIRRPVTTNEEDYLSKSYHSICSASSNSMSSTGQSVSKNSSSKQSTKQPSRQSNRKKMMNIDSEILDVDNIMSSEQEESSLDQKWGTGKKKHKPQTRASKSKKAGSKKVNSSRQSDVSVHAQPHIDQTTQRSQLNKLSFTSNNTSRQIALKPQKLNKNSNQTQPRLQPNKQIQYTNILPQQLLQPVQPTQPTQPVSSSQSDKKNDQFCFNIDQDISQVNDYSRISGNSQMDSMMSLDFINNNKNKSNMHDTIVQEKQKTVLKKNRKVLDKLSMMKRYKINNNNNNKEYDDKINEKQKQDQARKIQKLKQAKQIFNQRDRGAQRAENLSQTLINEKELQLHPAQMPIEQQNGNTKQIQNKTSSATIINKSSKNPQKIQRKANIITPTVIQEKQSSLQKSKDKLSQSLTVVVDKVTHLQQTSRQQENNAQIALNNISTQPPVINKPALSTNLVNTTQNQNQSLLLMNNLSSLSDPSKQHQISASLLLPVIGETTARNWRQIRGLSAINQTSLLLDKHNTTQINGHANNGNDNNISRLQNQSMLLSKSIMEIQRIDNQYVAKAAQFNKIKKVDKKQEQEQQKQPIIQSQYDLIRLNTQLTPVIPSQSQKQINSLPSLTLNSQKSVINSESPIKVQSEKTLINNLNPQSSNSNSKINSNGTKSNSNTGGLLYAPSSSSSDDSSLSNLFNQKQIANKTAQVLQNMMDAAKNRLYQEKSRDQQDSNTNKIVQSNKEVAKQQQESQLSNNKIMQLYYRRKYPQLYSTNKSQTGKQHSVDGTDDNLQYSSSIHEATSNNNQVRVKIQHQEQTIPGEDRSQHITMTTPSQVNKEKKEEESQGFTGVQQVLKKAKRKYIRKNTSNQSKGKTKSIKNKGDQKQTYNNFSDEQLMELFYNENSNTIILWDPVFRSQIVDCMKEQELSSPGNRVASKKNRKAK